MKTETIRLKVIKERWDDLSVEDQEAIEEGLNQLDEGQFVPYSEVRKKIESMLNPNRIIF